MRIHSGNRHRGNLTPFILACLAVWTVAGFEDPPLLVGPYPTPAPCPYRLNITSSEWDASRFDALEAYASRLRTWIFYEGISTNLPFIFAWLLSAFLGLTCPLL